MRGRGRGRRKALARIDFHSYGELVLWPFGYTQADTAPGMTQDQRDTFATLGTKAITLQLRVAARRALRARRSLSTTARITTRQDTGAGKRATRLVKRVALTPVRP